MLSWSYLNEMATLGAILILHKKNSGWVGLQNAYNCFLTLEKQAHFSAKLLIMWVGGL